MYNNYPLSIFPAGIKSYYMITMGYHVSRTFQQFFLYEKRNDFYEMILHHAVTVVLYTTSYMMNYIAVGTLVIYSLDQADVFVASSKAFSETPCKKLTYFTGVMMWVSWLYSRLICYPAVFYNGIFV